MPPEEQTPTPVTPTPAPVAPSAPPSAQPATPPTDDVAAIKADLEKTKKEYEDYRKQADPVLETIWADQELLTHATKVHNKRLGIGVGDENPAPPVNTPSAPVADPDTRQALIDRTQQDFEKNMGIDKLDEDAKREVRGKVGQMLKDMLDPKGNKTISRIFEEVSLVKLPWYMEKAYHLVNRDNDLKAAEARGKDAIITQYEGDRGMVGSVPGGSLPIDQVTLSAKERKAAASMGISEEDFLKEKKAMLEDRLRD